MLKRIILCAFAVAALGSGSALLAQRNYSGDGYAMFGVGSGGINFGEFLNAGGGGEAFVWKGLAAGGDIAYMWPHVSPSNGIGLLSLGPSWHFLNRAHQGRVVPFLNGGYGLAFRSGSANLYYLGGGATVWFASRAGLRLEFRHYGQRCCDFDNSIRFGIAFR
jgi:hypothetical protein